MTAFTKAMEEEWRDAPEFEERYEVSSLGRLRRKAGVVIDKRGIPRRFTERLVKGVLRRRYGYIMMTFRGTAQRPKQRLLHRLVARAFLGEPEAQQQVNHIDGCKTNNAIHNLEYVTPGENIRHALRLGLSPRGERHGKTTLSAEDVAELRRAHLATGSSFVALAKRFGVHPSTARRIVTRESWGHVP